MPYLLKDFLRCILSILFFLRRADALDLGFTLLLDFIFTWYFNMRMRTAMAACCSPAFFLGSRINLCWGSRTVVAMSLAPPPAAGRRRHRSSHEEPIHMTLGRASAQRSLGGRQQGHTRALSEPETVDPPSLPSQFISKLPPAVASVPLDDVRSYVHSKRVTHYQIGSTLGEGSFAKVKEGFHVLVGEKVSCVHDKPFMCCSRSFFCLTGKKLCLYHDCAEGVF